MPKRSRRIWVLLAAAALFANTFWLSTMQQPLIDKHEFRQTKTALSALFLQPGLEGLLNYQTPVLGALEHSHGVAAVSVAEPPVGQTHRDESERKRTPAQHSLRLGLPMASQPINA